MKDNTLMLYLRSWTFHVVFHLRMPVRGNSVNLDMLGLDLLNATLEAFHYLSDPCRPGSNDRFHSGHCLTANVYPSLAIAVEQHCFLWVFRIHLSNIRGYGKIVVRYCIYFADITVFVPT